MSHLPSPARVLVIDDDGMSRELLAVLLESEGYAVDSAESGEAALVLLGHSAAPPDVILADMQLPGIRGDELARQLRAACGTGTFLLAISGSQPAAAAVVRFDGFLLKPFRIQEVAAALGARNPQTGTNGSSGAKAKPAKARRANAARSGPVHGPRTQSATTNPTSAAASTVQTASNNRMAAPTQSEFVVHGEAIPNESDDPLPVLNETIFGQLAGAMPALQLQEMYRLCVGDARHRIAGMRKLAADRDGGPFVREAHVIKGGAGMLGATELHRRAAELESHGLAEGPHGESQDVNSLDNLSAACDRLERMLGSRL